MQIDSRWVQDALRDWGRRHRGEPGVEIGHKRQTNFAHGIRNRFTTEDAPEPSLPVSDRSMQVDAAVAFLRTRGEQGEYEAGLLELIYLRRLSQAKAARTLGVSKSSLQLSLSTAERTVELCLTMRFGLSPDDFNPSLLMFA